MSVRSLRSQLHELASQFADAIVTAIRGSSLEELLAQTGEGAKRGPGRPRGSTQPSETAARGRKSSRLPRRSTDEIAAELEKIVGLVKKAKTGLRAEEIRAALKMQSKELPRILKEGLATKVLKSKGQKRATTYTAA
jgi:hypothetical protein